MPPNFDIKTYFKPAERFTSLGQLFSDLFEVMTIVGAIIAIIYVIIGGIKIATGGDDPKQLDNGRQTIFYAIIGVVVMVLAFVVIQVVQYMLQSNIEI